MCVCVFAYAPCIQWNSPSPKAFNRALVTDLAKDRKKPSSVCYAKAQLIHVAEKWKAIEAN